MKVSCHRTGAHVAGHALRDKASRRAAMPRPGPLHGRAAGRSVAPSREGEVVRVLIVQPDAPRAAAWARALGAEGAEVDVAGDEAAAFAVISAKEVALIVLALELPGGAPLAVADYAATRRPGAQVICVTGSGILADGSAFRHMPNCRAVLGAGVAPRDLAQMAVHWGRASA